jgi:hypothetical protein
MSKSIPNKIFLFYCLLIQKKNARSVIGQLQNECNCFSWPTGEYRRRHQLYVTDDTADDVSDNSVSLLKSYLSNRKQQIKVNSVLSNWADIHKGVPQTQKRVKYCVKKIRQLCFKYLFKNFRKNRKDTHRPIICFT